MDGLSHMHSTHANSGSSWAPLLASIGAVCAIAGTIVSAIDARRPIGLRDEAFIAAVGGLLLLAIVILRSGEGAIPLRYRPFMGRALPWLAPGLAVFIMATMLVSKYGFRTCADLPASRQCPCYYVAWQYGARHGATTEEQTALRGQVRAHCSPDEIPPEWQGQ